MMNDTLIQKQEKQHKLLGYIGTTIVHVLLFLLLWWAVLQAPDPPPPYEGMGLTMALGEPDAGGSNPIPEEQVTPQEVTPEQPVEETPIETQEVEEAPAVVKPPKPVKEKKPVEKKVEQPVEKPRTVDQRSIFPSKKKSSTQSGEGEEGEAPGIKGASDGEPGGDPNGGGKGDKAPGSGGNGNEPFGYVLKDRSIVKRPTIEDNSKETGTVVLSIVVDKTGKVINARPEKGTTTLSPILLAKAKQAAFETKFSPNPNGPDQQFGFITITFRLRP